MIVKPTGRVSHRLGRRKRSVAMLREHYEFRGWQDAYTCYGSLLRNLVRRGARVLDVGRGRTFPTAPLLLETGAEVHGIDPVADPQQAPKGTVLKQGLAERIPYPDATFDIVASRCVLEHLRRPATAFSEFRRVLKPVGRFVFLTPSRYDYISIAARIVPNSFHGWVMRQLEGRSEKDTFPTYYAANSIRQVHRLAAQTGFGVEELRYYNHYPYLLVFSPFLCRLAIAYDELIGRHKHLLGLQAWLMGVLCRTTQSTGDTAFARIPGRRDGNNRLA